jgi:hypothetical protein
MSKASLSVVSGFWSLVRDCRWLSAARIGLVLAVAANASAAESDLDRLWDESLAIEKKIWEVNLRLSDARALMLVLGETVPDGADARLDEARKAFNAAESARNAAMAAAGLDRLDAEARAARVEQDRLAEAEIAGVPRFEEMKRARAAAMAKAEELAARLPRLSLEEMKSLCRARREAAPDLYELRRAFFKRPAVRPVYLDAKAKQEAHDAALGKDKTAAAAAQQAKTAKQALNEALAAAAGATADGKQAAEELVALERELEELKAALADKHGQVARTGWQTVKASLPVPEEEHRRSKGKAVRESTLDMPPGHDRLRAVFLSFSGAISGDPYVRGACAREGVGIVRISDRRISIFNYAGEAPGVLTEHLGALAEKSGHPEARTAPWVTAGCSASTLTARNVAYWKPERTVCAISLAGGNLHQNIDPQRTLQGVPFLCLNGEWECFGPVGGVRPEYGRQTQWVMIREQLLRWRAEDKSYLVNLVVIPGAEHAQWSRCVSRPTGLFIRKALRARVPPTAGEAGEPVKCLPVRPESGWLTDQDLTTPAYPPAPYAEFKGSSAKAFWHFDQELAEACEAVHREGLWLPDPTKQHPIPADWPVSQE